MKINIETSISRPIAAIVGALLVSGMLFAGPAFAANSYLAGYPDTTTVTKVEIFSAKTDFSGTTTSVPRSGSLSSVFSTAGFSSSGASDPNGWVHQHAVTLQAGSNNVRAIFQTWLLGTCKVNCPGDAGVSLGTYGTSSSHIDYVFSQFSVDSDSVNHQYEVVKNSGSVTQVFRDYDKSDVSDPTNFFSIGTKMKNTGTNTWKVKFFHFGIESSQDVTQDFNVYQYDLLYDGGFIANIDARTILWGSGVDHGQAITYLTTVAGVGGDDYGGADGDSDADGEVDWFDGTQPTGGTLLWS